MIWIFAFIFIALLKYGRYQMSVDRADRYKYIRRDNNVRYIQKEKK